MRTFRIVWAVALCLISIACAGETLDETDGGWEGTVDTVGEVTTVRTRAGSVWPGAAEFVEELSIGQEVGEEPYMFGRIQAVSATDDRIFVLDAQVPVIRVYDRDGAHILDIGQAGQGPGEFESPTFMALDGVGNLYVHDQGRLEVFSTDGEFRDTWSLEGLNAFTWFNEGNIGLDGTAYVPVVLERESISPSTWKIGYTDFHEGVAGETRPLPDLNTRHR